jgi:hypothetical protein
VQVLVKIYNIQNVKETIAQFVVDYKEDTTYGLQDKIQFYQKIIDICRRTRNQLEIRQFVFDSKLYYHFHNILNTVNFNSNQHTWYKWLLQNNFIAVCFTNIDVSSLKIVIAPKHVEAN